MNSYLHELETKLLNMERYIDYSSSYKKEYNELKKFIKKIKAGTININYLGRNRFIELRELERKIKMGIINIDFLDLKRLDTLKEYCREKWNHEINDNEFKKLKGEIINEEEKDRSKCENNKPSFIYKKLDFHEIKELDIGDQLYLLIKKGQIDNYVIVLGKYIDNISGNIIFDNGLQLQWYLDIKNNPRFIIRKIDEPEYIASFTLQSLKIKKLITL